MFSRNFLGAKVSMLIDDEGGEPRKSHVNESEDDETQMIPCVSSTPAVQMDLSASTALLQSSLAMPFSAWSQHGVGPQRSVSTKERSTGAHSQSPHKIAESHSPRKNSSSNRLQAGGRGGSSLEQSMTAFFDPIVWEKREKKHSMLQF